MAEGYGRLMRWERLRQLTELGWWHCRRHPWCAGSDLIEMLKQVHDARGGIGFTGGPCGFYVSVSSRVHVVLVNKLTFFDGRQVNDNIPDHVHDPHFPRPRFPYFIKCL